jgi:hypothetical protein
MHAYYAHYFILLKLKILLTNQVHLHGHRFLNEIEPLSKHSVLCILHKPFTVQILHEAVPIHSIINSYKIKLDHTKKIMIYYNSESTHLAL